MGHAGPLTTEREEAARIPWLTIFKRTSNWVGATHTGLSLFKVCGNMIALMWIAPEKWEALPLPNYSTSFFLVRVSKLSAEPFTM